MRNWQRKPTIYCHAAAMLHHTIALQKTTGKVDYSEKENWKIYNWKKEHKIKVPKVIVIKGVCKILNYCSSANPELWHINKKKQLFHQGRKTLKEKRNQQKNTGEINRSLRNKKQQETTSYQVENRKPKY